MEINFHFLASIRTWGCNWNEDEESASRKASSRLWLWQGKHQSPTAYFLCWFILLVYFLCCFIVLVDFFLYWLAFFHSSFCFICHVCAEFLDEFIGSLFWNCASNVIWSLISCFYQTTGLAGYRAKSVHHDISVLDKASSHSSHDYISWICDFNYQSAWSDQKWLGTRFKQQPSEFTQ